MFRLFHVMRSGCEGFMVSPHIIIPIQWWIALPWVVAINSHIIALIQKQKVFANNLYCNVMYHIVWYTQPLKIYARVEVEQFTKLRLKEYFARDMLTLLRAGADWRLSPDV